MRETFIGRRVTEVVIFGFETFIATNGAPFVSASVRFEMSDADGEDGGPTIALHVSVPFPHDGMIEDAERLLLDCALGVVDGVSATTTDEAFAMLLQLRDRKRMRPGM